MATIDISLERAKELPEFGDLTAALGKMKVFHRHGGKVDAFLYKITFAVKIAPGPTAEVINIRLAAGRTERGSTASVPLKHVPGEVRTWWDGRHLPSHIHREPIRLAGEASPQ